MKSKGSDVRLPGFESLFTVTHLVTLGKLLALSELEFSHPLNGGYFSHPLTGGNNSTYFKGLQGSEEMIYFKYLASCGL